MVDLQQQPFGTQRGHVRQAAVLQRAHHAAIGQLQYQVEPEQAPPPRFALGLRGQPVLAQCVQAIDAGLPARPVRIGRGRLHPQRIEHALPEPLPGRRCRRGRPQPRLDRSRQAWFVVQRLHRGLQALLQPAQQPARSGRQGRPQPPSEQRDGGDETIGGRVHGSLPSYCPAAASQWVIGRTRQIFCCFPERATPCTDPFGTRWPPSTRTVSTPW